MTASGWPHPINVSFGEKSPTAATGPILPVEPEVVPKHEALCFRRRTRANMVRLHGRSFRKFCMVAKEPPMINAEDVYFLTYLGKRELDAAGTSLSRSELELLVLIDGKATVGQVPFHSRGALAPKKSPISNCCSAMCS